MRRPLGLAALLCGLASLSAQPPAKPIVFAGHSDTVYAVAPSPDGKLLLTAGLDHSVRLFDAATGKELRRWDGANGHKALALAVAFSPLGDRVASGSSDNTLRVWDVPQSGPSRVLPTPAQARAIAAADNGKMLAACAADGSVTFFDETGKATPAAPGPKDTFAAVTTATPSGFVALGLAGGLTFRAADGKSSGDLIIPGKPSALATIGNSAFVATADGLVRLYATSTPTQDRAILPPAGTTFIASALRADGAALALAGTDKSLKIFDATTGDVKKEFARLDSPAKALALTATHLAVASSGGRIVIHSADGSLLADAPHPAGAPDEIAFPANAFPLATLGRDGVARIWTAPPAPIKATTLPADLALWFPLADGKRVLVASPDKTLRLLTLGTLALEKKFAGLDAVPTCLTAAPGGEWVAAGGNDGSIRVWDRSTAKLVNTIGAHSGKVVHMRAIGTSLISFGADGLAKFWTPLPPPTKLFAHPDLVQRIFASADGSRLLTLGNDHQLRAWNTANGQTLYSASMGGKAIRLAAGSDDGTGTVMVSTDGEISAAKDGKEIKKWPAFAPPPRAVCVGNGGATIALAFPDKTLKFYTSADGKEAKSLALDAPASHLHLTSANELIAVLEDGTIRLFGADGKEAAKEPLATPAVEFCYRAATKQFAAITKGGKISLGSLGEKKPLASFDAPKGANRIGLSNDGLRVVASGGALPPTVFERDGRMVENYPSERGSADVAMSADGKGVFAVSADKSVKLFTGSFVKLVALGGPAIRAAVTPNGQTAFVALAGNKIEQIDFNTGKSAGELGVLAAEVIDLDLAPDGLTLASAGADNSLTFWNLAKKGETKNVKLTTAVERMTPAGPKAFAVVTKSGVSSLVRLFDSATGIEKQVLADSASPILAITADAEGKRVSFASADKQVRTTDVLVTTAVAAHAAGPGLMAWHPNGSQFVTAGTDKSLRLFDAAGKELKRIELPTPATALAYSLDGATLSVAVGPKFKAMNPADLNQVGEFEAGFGITGIAWNNNRTLLMLTGADGVARVLESGQQNPPRPAVNIPSVSLMARFRSQTAVAVVEPLRATLAETRWQKTFFVGDKAAWAFAVANNGQLLCGCADGFVRAYNPNNGNREKDTDVSKSPVAGLGVSRDYQLMAVALEDKSIALVRPNEQELLLTIKTPSVHRRLSLTADRRFLVGLGDDGVIRVWHTRFEPGNAQLPEEFGRVLQEFAADGAIDLGLTDKGLIYAGGPKGVSEFKLAPDSAYRTFNLPAAVDAVAFDPTGEKVISGCHDGKVRTFDIEKNAVIKEFVAHAPQPPDNQKTPIYAIALTPDGKQILTASFDHSLKLCDLTAGTVVRDFKGFDAKAFPKGHHDAVLCCGVSAGGTLAVSGSADRTLRLWTLADGTVAREFVNPDLPKPSEGDPLPSHPGWVNGVRFVRKDTQIVSAGVAPKGKGFVALWNVADGKLIKSFEVDQGPVQSLAVSPDGSKLILGLAPRNRRDPQSEAIVIPMPE